ncbi:hypothetical protein diail_9566 [Diaporthe ilicicola]|nr:hypothetical protein diail_9566 [Diaporthe ilicicola]
MVTCKNIAAATPTAVSSVPCMLLVAGAGCKSLSLPSCLWACCPRLSTRFSHMACDRYSCMRRGEIREGFNMDKNCCSDCMVSLCCHCCAVIQQEKEVETRLSGVVSEIPDLIL